MNNLDSLKNLEDVLCIFFKGKRPTHSQIVDKAHELWNTFVSDYKEEDFEKVIEYVEQLKQAGFEIYQIEGYKSAIIHDEAVFYSLTNYNYPKDNGIRIDKQNLPQVRDFASNGYDNTVRFLNLIESMGTGKDYLNHNDRVYYAYKNASREGGVF